MFLKTTRERNPGLIETAFELHKRGKIEPDTYVLDLDVIRENSQLLAKKAVREGFKLYFMTKQLGRNPAVAKAIAESGIEKAVAVDPWEAKVLYQAGVKIGNVGHLVQIPSQMIKEILAMRPEIITVYSLAKAMEIAKVASQAGFRQDLMLRVMDHNSFNFTGQKGGFYRDELDQVIPQLKQSSGVRVVGITAFPCLLYDYQKKEIKPTSNLKTVLETAAELKEKYSINFEQINTPSVTCIQTIPYLKSRGATHGEPGHALTGTTPYHADYSNGERPALIYVSEISHKIKGRAYAYGGGFYGRSHLKKALVGSSREKILESEYNALQPEKGMIDYYSSIEIANNSPVNVGDTVLYTFRTQIFVTRSKVAVVSGIQQGKIEIVGIYDSQGRLLREGERL